MGSAIDIEQFGLYLASPTLGWGKSCQVQHNLLQIWPNYYFLNIDKILLLKIYYLMKNYPILSNIEQIYYYQIFR